MDFISGFFVGMGIGAIILFVMSYLVDRALGGTHWSEDEDC